MAFWGEEGETFGDDGHVRGIDGSDGFLDVNIAQTYHAMPFRQVWFIVRYHSVKLKKKKKVT